MTTIHAQSRRVRLLTSATLALFTYSGIASAQAPAGTTQLPWATAQTQPAASPQAPTAQSAKTFSQEELEQLLAPVALYPDSLLAHVLMASTYPIEIVQAERWVKANPKLKDKALEDALQKQTWDESVKSLCVFPQVLTMMSEKLDWTQKLGDAFLAQKEDVMATAQALRNKAVAQGTLKDSEQQKVVTEKVEQTTIIKIEPSNPEVVYVPTYNPTVVYGSWPYPAYPPYYYYPPGYVAGGALLGFTAGVIVGGALWGNIGWGNNDINIDIDRHNNFNRTNVSNKNWQHNAQHRGAVPYKDRAVSEKYNRGTSQGAQARDAYRGRADTGATARTSDMSRARDAATARSGGAADRAGGGQSFNRDYSGTRGGSALDTGSRAQTRDYSSRGSSSMASSRGASSASRGASMGGARGGGGGGRGGGGRR